MNKRRIFSIWALTILVFSLVFGGNIPAAAQTPQPPGGGTTKEKQPKITQADRQAAAQRAADAGLTQPDAATAAMAMPGEAPHYFSVPNYANSPLPGNIVADWNAIAQEILQPTPMPGMPAMSSVSMSAAFVHLSYVQAAVYNALVAIEGGYTPYNSTLVADPTASRDAAVAAAAYGVLKHYFPMEATLDAKYADSLASIPDDAAKAAGITAGAAAAAEIIALRATDTLSGTGGYVVPAPGLGVWQPNVMPDGTVVPPMDPWMAVLQPFLRATPQELRPVPPPALDDPAYLADLAEVTDIGGAMSMTRTAAQTEVAQFWTTNMVIQTNAAYRQVAAGRGLGLLDTARLMALGNMAATDSLIATFDAKYTYNFWRPYQAIQATTPGWMPLAMTPNFPEYVAGHGSFVSAQAEVYTQILGTDLIGVDLSSSVTGTTRHYASAADLRTEIIDARTWAGLHFRNSSILAVGIGQQLVTNAVAANYFTPAAALSTHDMVSGGIRKFVDGLPGLGAAGANNLGVYIPVAVPDTSTYPGSDYYEIAVVQYEEKMHSDLPPTLLRGYVQLSTSVVPGDQVPLSNALLNGTSAPIAGFTGVTPPHYLGPTIVASKNRPVRILFRNLLPTGVNGNLFIPVDTTVMGSGMGPLTTVMAEPDPRNPMCGMPGAKTSDCYTENRATLHLHGGISPWISDGTPHQWITPANENTPYPQGVSVVPVPDMKEDTGSATDGAMTFFYTNQQSARLMFYHDHAWGITRLNVYAGEAAGYLITDAAEQKLITDGTIPGADSTIPLIIQDKTFVPSQAQLSVSDPTWDVSRWGKTGDLWVPHVYVPAQNPGDPSGVNQYGRWAYGPWFWPPTSNIDYPPVDNPYFNPACVPSATQWCEPPLMPGTPYLSMGMEAFNDTPLVNGTVYPTVTVDPKTYRFRVLNAANDRFFNLSLYKAVDANGLACDLSTNPTPAAESTGIACTEVALNPAEVAAALADPTIFPTPLAGTEGPNWIQIGTEGGFLPGPTVIPAQPTTWVTDPTVFNAGNVDLHSLLIGPAERADVIVDFSAFAGQTLILYNDAPAAFPARDPRYDYYTGNGDYRDTGGAPSTLAGYGPNTRTVMQIKVAAAAPAPAFNLAALENAFAHQADGSGIFESSQNKIIVGQAPYNTAYGTNFPAGGPMAGLVQIYDNALAFQTLAGVDLTFPLEPKAIQDEMGEAFEKEYGRMSGNLGVEAPNAQAGLQQNLILYPYVNPASEILKGVELPKGQFEAAPIATTTDGTQIWKITHNGVDTHPIHFHLYDVQLINRVGWDGIIRQPDANELGWKDTVRISPLEDTIVALRPVVPKIPFGLPDSVRPLNPMMPLGDASMFVSTDILGNPINPPITNIVANFGWEYVWHCHILSHEEMDMMRPVTVAVSRALATPPVVTLGADMRTLNWTDGTPVTADPLTWGGSDNEIGYRVERAPILNNGRPGTYAVIGNTLANVTTFVDPTPGPTIYSYRVVAYNAAGNSTSAAVGGAVATAPNAPTNVTALLQTGLKITVTWRDNSNNESFFLLERSVDGGAFALITTPTANTTSFVDATIASGHSYQYRVAAVNNGGTSTYGLSASVAVPLAPLAPSGLTGTAVRSGKKATVTLNWTDNSLNESGFTLQSATNASFTVGVTNNVLAANTITAKLSLYRGVTYFFRIRAEGLGGSSAWSTVFSIITP